MCAIDMLFNKRPLTYLLTYLLNVKRPLEGWLRGTVVERQSVTGNFPCPTLDLQLMVDQLCG